MDGILNVYKPVGPTSHDIVDIIRRLSGQRRVGHAGTLDPAASGVLLVCLGLATRVVEYMADHDKEYCAEIALGQSTDTYDASGRPTAPAVTPAFTREEVAAALGSFVGEIEQTAPPFSALKQAGQPLYRLARAGKEVRPPVRRVRVYGIELLAWEPPTLEIIVKCSKGTYIRSLAHDLGQRLGCGGHLRGLLRLASGPFRLADASTPAELEHAFSEGYAADLLYPLDEALLDLPAAILTAESAAAVRRGQLWRGPLAAGGLTLCRAYTTAGDLLALLANVDGTTYWRPRKVFEVGA